MPKEIAFYGSIIEKENDRHLAFTVKYNHRIGGCYGRTTSEGLPGLIVNTLDTLLENNDFKEPIIVKLIGTFSEYDFKRIHSMFEMYGKAENIEVSFKADVEEYKFQSQPFESSIDTDHIMNENRE